MKKEKAVKAMEAQTAVKTLEDMNLLDDFLFGAVVAYPEIGERFVRSILKMIFGREFKHLSVTAQKVFYGADTSLHGTRLDVYMEPEMEVDEEEHAVVYDIEPDRNDKPADIKALPRKVRFYHGKIAARSLNSGAGYDDLKNVVIIMIMPYDPFGQNRMVYTIKNKCVELPKMEYDDGASTLFLYTKGTEGIPSAAMEQLLHYMENSTYENAVNEELRKIHRMVETVKRDPEVGGMRIQILEENYELKQEVTRQAEENKRQAEENKRQTEENKRQAEEIKRLREELNRKNGEA
ncbi:MAG: hypothetical protein K2K20_02655 [Lachnospiraceae bacterium]|nr:hypothetical protein [Lachnospiraceae bacterium]